ncbi:MAG: PHP domain-containing protein [Desulfobacterales bacterium]|nr:MAG: PHP domain-containing protein [Desulfobacterales bacterium]
MLKRFKADLHIHTCLSPCSEWEMSPQNIVARSRDSGLDLIAVCDHNSAENAAAAIRAGQKQGLAVLPGMEICSREEVHILTLFGDLEKALAMQDYVYARLPGKNQPDVFGFQVVANEFDEVLGENSRLLIGATQLGLHDIEQQAHTLGGLCLCSHVDRPGFGIIGQLGFIPPDLVLDGVEVSYRVPLSAARDTIPGIGRLPCVTSSDAHRLAEIGRANTGFVLAAPTLEEIRLALEGKDGRKIAI